VRVERVEDPSAVAVASNGPSSWCRRRDWMVMGGLASAAPVDAGVEIVVAVVIAALL
jgi:hypothetical protein